ncbi:hypothetical protein ES705_23097 [subsurface metagenome]
MKNDNKKFDISRYSEIKDVTNKVKLPIGGRIKLGILKVSPKTGVEYPTETDYFVCPPEVRKIFGDEPTELTVFFPIADRKKIFQQSYERYGKNKALQCWGDGITAQEKNLEDGSWEDRKCPCEHLKKGDETDVKEKRGCSKRGHLRFMIPSVSIGTFYELVVGGTVSFQEINSALALADKTTAGHWAMIPFRMQRIQKRLTIPGTAKMRAHWIVTLEPTASLEEVRRVAGGEILYLGQQRDKKYELEITEPVEAKENEAVRVGETEEGKAGDQEEQSEPPNEKEMEKIKAEGQDLKEENKIKSSQNSKTIYKKETKEEDKALDEKSLRDQLDKIFETLREAGLETWKEIAYFACLADLKEPGSPLEELKRTLLDDPKAVEKIIRLAKIKEEEQ